MAQLFYLWDVTSQAWRGRVALSIPKIGATNAECMSQLRTITGGSSGRYITMTSDIFSGITNLFGAGTLTMPFPTAIDSAHIEAGEGSSVLIAAVRALSSLGDVISGQYYRLCVDPDNHEDNYLELEPAWNDQRGIHVRSVKFNGILHQYSTLGIGFSVIYNSTSGEYGNAYLAFLAFTLDGIASCNSFAPGLQGNIGFNAVLETAHYFEDWYNAAGPAPEPSTDPYEPGGTSTPSGPNTGTWTLINDDVDFPDLPEITASDTGFFSIWVPTLEQIQLLAGFMWNTDPLNIDFWKNMVASPLDLILGLSLFPVELDVDGHEPLTLGLVDTRIDTNYRNAQFVDVDCGELDLEEYYGAFLDYAPFTQLDIYLPYIGVRTINVNDVMPKRLHLRYRIDLVSGSCVAMLKADNSVYYHWNGACSVAIPVTTNQMRDLVQGVVSAAGAVASGIMTGGISGALAAASGVASAAVNSSQHVGRSGTMGSAAGFLGVQTPYLIITRPRQAIPENQNHYTGYPTFITSKLGDLLGYTEVEAVHLHDIPATSDELDEIERLLGEGVIL